MKAFRPPISSEPSIVLVLPQADRSCLSRARQQKKHVAPVAAHESVCIHTHYERLLANPPWHERLVEVQFQARRFRCVNPSCSRNIFTERLPKTVLPKGRRTARLCKHHLAIGLAEV